MTFYLFATSIEHLQLVNLNHRLINVKPIQRISLVKLVLGREEIGRITRRCILPPNGNSSKEAPNYT